MWTCDISPFSNFLQSNHPSITSHVWCKPTKGRLNELANRHALAGGDNYSPSQNIKIVTKNFFEVTGFKQ